MDFDIHREAATLAFGKPVKPYYRLDQAKRIVALDCDFIGAEEDLPRLIRDFAQGRKIESPDKAQGEDLINRLYVVESLMTLTGVNADHRLRVPPSAVLPVAAALAAEVIPQGGGEVARRWRRWASPPAWMRSGFPSARRTCWRTRATASWWPGSGSRWRCMRWRTP